MEGGRFNGYESLPIPTYEQAISSRPPSSHRQENGAESSRDAEREGLLALRSAWPSGYRPPTVESARSSMDTDALPPLSQAASSRSSDEALRGEMQELELDDPLAKSSLFSKRFLRITHTLSSIQLPSIRFPSLHFLRPKLPHRDSLFWPVLGRTLILFLVGGFVYIIFFSNILIIRSAPVGTIYDPESVRSFVQGHVDGSEIRDYLAHLTSFDHIAGTEGDYLLAKWVEELFVSAGLDDVELKEYQVYLNYPRKYGRRVAIIDPPELAWQALLEEDPVYPNPTPSQKQSLVFHGLSRAGNVTGPLIYANYGSREDFKTLASMGIEVKGSIVLVRYYGTQGDRALKIKAAEISGAIGCIIYSDPNEDGFVKGPAWPEGRYRPSDGVQRGSASLMSWVVGDVLTPGWASTKDAKRISKDNNSGLVNIPSLPLAWRDAQKLLQAIKGHGQPVRPEWVGGVPDVESWWTGNQTSPTVHLMNLQDEVEKQPIWNNLGVIKGQEQMENTVFAGCHRDAWCFGGGDPGSGTAILLEVLRIFGSLHRAGWRPLRSIIFAVWDAEEYNLIGSTEWVEDNVEILRRNSFAYLNLDTAVYGTEFKAKASPVFERALLRVLDRTMDPRSNRTLRSLWDENKSQLGGLGAGSDYVAFQDIAGTSSIDMAFSGESFPVYHSCYDSFQWMSKFGDPTFEYHKVMAQVFALLILEISDRPILPFDLTAYAAAVKGYVADLEKLAHEKGGNDKLSMKPLKEASEQFINDAQEFEKWENEWMDEVYGAGGGESSTLAIRRMSHNTRMANFETHLLDLDEGGGLPGRNQFKHILFAPQAWSGYDAAYFPGILDAIDDGDWDAAQKQVVKAANILSKASLKLLY
ncbi:MAG: hypothetical protein M1829_001869 [Trizodia sp. TS-e1964]|nr:MAG: hypothetical protein M1829_001869 [Trizodia sp. TS-e1964]